MLLGGWSAVDVTAVEYPAIDKIGGVTQALLAGKGVSNLQSNFLLGLGDARAFLNLPRRAI